MDKVDDPQLYQQRRESFTRSLQHFHEIRGTPFRKVPRFCGQEVDLFKLYNIVTQRGGWLKVNRTNQWDQLLKDFNIPAFCVNGGNALKQVYLRYLDRYEKVHFLGESGDRNDDDDEDGRVKGWRSRSMHVVPLSYNHNQHNVPEVQRRACGLSLDVYKNSGYERLLLSLVSPLPNEQDFAINVCTLLSNDGKYTMKFDRCPRLLDYLLAHAGIYNHSSLRVLFEEVYGTIRKHSITTFWSDVLNREDLSDLIDENKFIKKPPRKLKVIKSFGLSENETNIRVEGKQNTSELVRTEFETPSGNQEHTGKHRNNFGNQGKKCVTNLQTRLDQSQQSVVKSTELSNQSSKAIPDSKTKENSHEEKNLTKDIVNGTKIKEAQQNYPSESDITSENEKLAKSEQDKGVDVRLEPSTLPCTEKPTEVVKVQISETENATRTFGEAYLNLQNSELMSMSEAVVEDKMDEISKNPETEPIEICTTIKELDQNSDNNKRIEETTVLSESNVNNKLRKIETQKIEPSGIQCVYVDPILLEAERERKAKDEEDRMKKELAEAEMYEAMLAQEKLKCKTFTNDEPTSKRTKTEPWLNIQHEDKDLFCVGRSLGTQDYVGQRVLQVAHILRNLSFYEDNMQLMAKNSSFIRFLLLCANSSWSCLHQLGLDMLGNISPELHLEDPLVDRLSNVFFSTVSRGVAHNDRFIVISCLEVLNKISQKVTNEEIVSKHLDQTIYNQVCKLLGLQDIMILLYTLECLYALSSLGEKACNSICKVHGAVDILLALVTVEAQSYGSKACILMRVIETVSGFPNTAPQAPPPPQPASSPVPLPQPPVTGQVQLIQHSPVKTTTQNIMRQTPTTIKTMIGMPQAATATPVQFIPIPPQPSSPIIQIKSSTVTTPSVNPALISMPTVQQQHAHQQTAQENEQFALAWLRATFELCAGGKIEQQELYKKYLDSCAKMGRKGVVPALHFPRCVRSVFGGTVGPKSHAIPVTEQKPGGPISQSFYDGIKVRDVPLTINIKLIPFSEIQTPLMKKQRSRITKTDSACGNRNRFNNKKIMKDGESQVGDISPTSPILKAQLISPSKTSPTQEQKTQQVTTLHPQLSQALLSTSSSSTSTSSTSTSSTLTSTNMDNSTLIKSLLASKVSELCMSSEGMLQDNKDQVTQRQQQQKMLQQQQLQNKALESITKAQLTRINGIVQDSQEKEKKEPPQPPTVNTVTINSMGGNNLRPKTPIVEDSDSMASTSRDCTTVGGNLSSAEENDNSLTSFEGILLNGVPESIDFDAAVSSILDEKCNNNKNPPTSASTKPLMLADLLDKKETPTINGVLGKELRIGDKGLELVENHIERALKQTASVPQQNGVCENNRTGVDNSDSCESTSVKRSSVDSENKEPSAKKLKTEESVTQSEQKSGVVVSGEQSSETVNIVQSSETKEKGGDEKTSEEKANEEDDGNSEEEVRVSSTAANLFAALAAEALEDETDLEVPTEESAVQQQTVVMPGAGQMRQVFLGDASQLIVTASPSGARQIIMTPTNQQGQVLISAGGQITLQQGSKPIVVQNQRIVQNNTTQQMIAAPQYIVSGNSSSQVLIAQPQTALVQGQTQTVLVAQSSQQTTGTKTIIILQPQQQNTTGGQQKVVVTPQGQQMVVTQVARSLVPQQPPSLVPTSARRDSETSLDGTQVVLGSGMQNNPGTQIQVVSSGRQNTASPTQIQVISSGMQNNPPKTTVDTGKRVVNGGVKSSVVTTVSTTPTTPSTSKTITSDPNLFLCEWRNCLRGFKTANDVYLHVCAGHVPVSPEQETQCLWIGCDGMKRKRFSLMTHIYDRHCNPEILTMVQQKRKQLSTQGRGCEMAPQSQAASPHPGYAPNAAFHAIKRHAFEFINPKELQKSNGAKSLQGTATSTSTSINTTSQVVSNSQPTVQTPSAVLLSKSAPVPTSQDDNEGPVTKSIRLTASLILRNLVIYSPAARRFLRGYESHLASIALSNVESSRTIAQMLADLNDGSNSL